MPRISTRRPRGASFLLPGSSKAPPQEGQAAPCVATHLAHYRSTARSNALKHPQARAPKNTSRSSSTARTNALNQKKPRAQQHTWRTTAAPYASSPDLRSPRAAPRGRHRGRRPRLFLCCAWLRSRGSLDEAIDERSKEGFLRALVFFFIAVSSISVRAETTTRARGRSAFCCRGAPGEGRAELEERFTKTTKSRDRRC